MGGASAALISPREAEVLAAVGEGLTNARIAERFFLSVRTVESHVASLLRKLDAADRRELGTLAPSTGAGLVGLPTAWTSFVGRVSEQRDVRAALATDRLVTLVGPGGTGKTRLAAVVAAEVAATLERGGAWADLVPARADSLLATIAAAVGVGDEPERSLLDVIRTELAKPGGYLLVLDNCEHLVAEVADVLTVLLAGCAQLTVLVTSRQRLGLPGERVLHVSPLALEPADPADDPLDADAIRLFTERALTAGAEVTDRLDLVAQICDRLDGLPLAIEIAAARVAALGPDGVLAATSDTLGFLTGNRGPDARHGSLRTVLDWSYALLEDDERAMFDRLGIFSGVFDLAAAAAVGDTDRAADLIGRLVDKSLVVHLRTAAGSRWRLLEAVRQYAYDQLLHRGDLAATADRRLSWAADSAAALAARVEESSWQAEFDLIADDLRAAATASPDSEPGERVHRLARSLGALAYARRLVRESERWYRTAAARAPDSGDAIDDLRRAGEVAIADLRGDDAYATFLDAAGLAERAGDDGARATCLARAVTVAARHAGMMREDRPVEQLIALREQAERILPDGDLVAAAHVAVAAAWTSALRLPDTTEAAALVALERARRADHPVLITAALDAVAVAPAISGRVREGYQTTMQRVELLTRLPRSDPASACEVIDTAHMVNTMGTFAGDLPHALDVVRRLQHDVLLEGTGYNVASKPITMQVLSGQFDDALTAAAAVWDDWVSKGRPAASWMSKAIAAIALAHGLRGDAGAHADWTERTFAVSGNRDLTEVPDLAEFLAFTEPRLAVHLGDLDTALTSTRPLLDGQPDWYTPHSHWFHAPYGWAFAAEVAVLAGLPDARQRLQTAAPVGVENKWAAACLARAHGRLEDSPELLTESVRLWEAIDARFERAVTLLLLPDRADEGQAELSALGCPRPELP